MTSLSEAYEEGARTVVDRRQRLSAGVLFAVGVALGAVAIGLTTTGLRSWAGLGVVEAREIAGVLAGLGLPAALVGIVVALPTSDETRAAAVIGSSLTAFGVLLFVYAYPSRWLANEPALAIATVGIYALGMLVTFWCLFVAVATFSDRNDPGGTARVEITDEGTVRLIGRDEESESEPESGAVPAVPGLGGVGFLGRDPDGDVATQTNDGPAGEAGQAGATNRDSGDVPPQTGGSQAAGQARSATTDHDTGGPSADRRGAAQRRAAGTGPEPTSDGGPTVAQEPGVERIGSSGGQPDRYCGNCAFFEYAETGDGLDPYCRYHGEYMDDLDACEQWTTNTGEE